MTDLTITRKFSVDPETVFAFVTQQENIEKWWGPEGMSVPMISMNLDQTGPWSSVIQSSEGNQYKVTGVVEKVDPPNSVEFTWGWHDDQDERGHESRVRFEIRSDGHGGTEFTLIHSSLADEESAQNHNQGWASSLRKLEKMAI